MPVPLADDEVRRLEKMNMNGVIEIVGNGSVGKGPKIRVILVMQKPVVSPVEFLLPEEGTLILVQSDQKWILEPKEYKASKKTIGIKPSPWGNRTYVDYDIGNGRAGSEAFSWAK